jgi:hypothetical protein
MVFLACFIERNQEIVRLRTSGMTLHAIGQKFGVTRETIRQICLKDERAKARADRSAKMDAIRADVTRMIGPSLTRFQQEDEWTPERQYREFESARSE